MNRRWFSVLFILLNLLAGCDNRSLRQRAEEIREFSDKEDRAFSAEAVNQVRRKYWTLRDGAWLGRLPDGVIVRLDAPHAAAAPLPSRAFYSGWHLQLTISSDAWSTFPASPHDTAFEAVYAITRHSPTNWDIRVSDGPVTSPLHREDVARLEQ